MFKLSAMKKENQEVEGLACFVISLERDAHKRNIFYHRWNDFPNEIVWLEAVDGASKAKVQESVKKLGLELNVSILPLHYSGYRGGLSDGELGCALSHLLAWDYFINDLKNNLLFILEDDALPVSLEEIIQAIGTFRDSNADVLMLGYRKNLDVISKLGGLKLRAKLAYSVVKMLFCNIRTWREKLMSIGWEVNKVPSKLSKNWAISGSHFGTFAYVLKRTAAEELLHLNRHVNLRSDECLTVASSLMRVKSLNVLPRLVNVDQDMKSSIRSGIEQKRNFAQDGA